MSVIINCQLNNPVDLGTSTEDWEYSEIVCTSTDDTTIQLTDGDYTAYVKPELNLGDLFLIGFLVVLVGAIIFHLVWHFIHPQIWKLKSKTEL
jgi:hypothetical protein